MFDLLRLFYLRFPTLRLYIKFGLYRISKISYIRNLFKIWFIQNSSFSGFSL